LGELLDRMKARRGDGRDVMKALETALEIIWPPVGWREDGIR